MRRRGLLVAFLGFLTLSAGPLFFVVAQTREPVDRILAVVDDKALQRRILDLQIEQKLRFHEVDRFGFAEVPVDAVEDEVAKLRDQFGSEEAFEERLSEVGLTVQNLRQIFARQVMVLIYVEERLGARVFVGLEDIQEYYDNILVPESIEAGEAIPPIQQVREPIRALLREQRMNEEFEIWTVELRSKADIEDFFDSRYSELPEIVYSSS